jgi:hypothetical protein
MRDATRCSRWQSFRRTGFERLHLVRAQSPARLRLQDRIGSGRAAAQVRVGNRSHFETEREQDLLDRAAELHAVLQRARRVERNAQRPLVHRHHRRHLAPLGADHLDRIARERGDALRLVGVILVVAKQVPIDP